MGTALVLLFGPIFIFMAVVCVVIYYCIAKLQPKLGLHRSGEKPSRFLTLALTALVSAVVCYSIYPALVRLNQFLLFKAHKPLFPIEKTQDKFVAYGEENFLIINDDSLFYASYPSQTDGEHKRVFTESEYKMIQVAVINGNQLEFTEPVDIPYYWPQSLKGNTNSEGKHILKIYQFNNFEKIQIYCARLAKRLAAWQSTVFNYEESYAKCAGHFKL